MSRQTLPHFAGFAAIRQAAAALALIAASPWGYAQAVSNPYSYSRTSSFEYYQPADGAKNGLLKKETIEPDDPASCIQTTHTWDSWGNKATVTTANCAGATGEAVFTSRATTQTWSRSAQPTFTMADGRVLTLQPGQFPLDSKNALNQNVQQLFDPRFGSPTQVVDSNSRTVSFTYDTLGRKTREDRADGTAQVWRYCILSNVGLNTTTNVGDCFDPVEAPADAIAFVQSWPVDTNDKKMGPWSMVFTDRAGRTLRTATEGFDGPDQPATVIGGSVVKDTVYDNLGNKVLESQPYYLDTGSSLTTGSNNVGATKMLVDALGRPRQIYVVESQGTRSVTFGASAFAGYGAYGTRNSALTEYTYAGSSTTTKEYYKVSSTSSEVSRSRKVEKNPLGEVVRVTDDKGAQVVHQNDAFGNARYFKDSLGNANWVTSDVRGRTISTNTSNAGLWESGFNALGEKIWQRNPKQRNKSPATRTEMEYDKLGRLIDRLDDEYSSHWYYDVDAAGASCSATGTSIGSLCESQTSHGVRKRLRYDAFGRPTSERTDVEGGISAASSVQWETSTGRMIKRTWPTALAVSYGYTTLGYPLQAKLVQSATINPLPYSAGGTPGASVSWDANKVIWRAEAVNAWGKSERYSNGLADEEGLITTRTTFDSNNGRIYNRYAGQNANSAVLSLGLTYDTLGRVTSRADRNGTEGFGDDVSENFTYDSLDRLINYTVAHPEIPSQLREVDLTYNALGMLLKRSDVGSYSYVPVTGETAPHTLKSVTDLTGAVTTYLHDANGNTRSASDGKYRYSDYNSFNQPNSELGIRGPVVSGSGSPRYTWQYDSEHQRIKETRQIFGTTANAGTRTTWRLHPDNQGGLGFEYEVDAPTTPSAAYPATQQARHYITMGGQVVAVMVTDAALPTLSDTQMTPPGKSVLNSVRKVEFWHVDHLGSIITTTNHAGGVTARYSYDPFGQRRFTNGGVDPDQTINVDWDPALSRYTGNGFTSHEHLDDIGIVHMNGRLFDPRLGVFLQPDPVLQDPFSTQNYNRYGYCYNSPMGCTDMSGYCFMGCFWQPKNWGALRWVAAIGIGYMLGPGSWALIDSSLSYAAVANAAIAGFASGAISSGTLKGAIQGAFSGALFAGVGDYLHNTGIMEGMPGAGGGELGFGAVALHGVAGCVSSVASGGKCGPGALSAAFSQAALPFKEGLGRVGGTVASAIIGGTASVLGGGKFGNGAKTAAFGYLFNECFHTKMCGSDSTKVEIQGNVAAGALGTLTEPTSIHLSVSISDGYGGISTLDGQPRLGLLCTLCLNGEVSSLPKQNIVWGPYELSTPAGLSKTSFANSLVYRAELYWDFTIPYSIPHIPSGTLGSANFNSNSWAAGLLQKTMGNAPNLNFAPYQAPGYANPLPKFLFGR